MHARPTPHTSPWRASYGVSFVSYSKKNHRDISRAYCIGHPMHMLLVDRPCDIRKHHNRHTLLSVYSQEVGVTKPISSDPLFSRFSAMWIYTLAIEYHVYAWQVWPLSCGDTCQIWLWLKEFNRYFCKIENFVYGEIIEGALVTPTPAQKVLSCPGMTDTNSWLLWGLSVHVQFIETIKLCSTKCTNLMWPLR